MINLNKTNINIISLSITIIVFLAIILSIQKISKGKSEIIIPQNEQNKIDNEENIIDQEIAERNKNIDMPESQIKELPQKWSIDIKSVNISGNIVEMETEEVPENGVGHIEKTTINGNNIALIAYNFGKPKNYFANLKELKAGEEIIYNVEDTKRTYKVLFNKIVEKKELEDICKRNDKENHNYLKLFTYIIDLKDKLRYVCAKEIIK